MVPTVWFIAPSSFANLSSGIVTSATGAGQALRVPFRPLALQPWPRKHSVVVSSLHETGVRCRRCQLRRKMSPSRPPTLKKGEMMAPRGWAHTTGVLLVAGRSVSRMPRQGPVCGFLHAGCELSVGIGGSAAPADGWRDACMW